MWQFKVHTELARFLPIARAIEEFEVNGIQYLVLEYIKGDNLQDSIDGIYGEKKFKMLPVSKKLILIGWVLEALQILRRLHLRGYVHRDISASNFIVSKSKLFLLDLEQVWNIKSTHGGEILFPCWTKGYSSPQQILNWRPTVMDDIYSFGALMINLFTHVHPKNLNLKQVRSVAAFLCREIAFPELVDLVLKCIDPKASCRPEITEIEKVVISYRHFIKNI